MTQYMTAFKRHLSQFNGNMAKTHRFMKEFYMREAIRKWTVKEGEQKTKRGFKTRIDIIDDIKDLFTVEVEDDIFTPVEIETGETTEFKI